jgi:hypothetical protein
LQPISKTSDACEERSSCGEQDAEKVPTCEDDKLWASAPATLHPHVPSADVAGQAPDNSANVAGQAPDNSANVAGQAPDKFTDVAGHTPDKQTTDLQRALQLALQRDLQATALKKTALAVAVHAVSSIPSFCR